MPPRYACIPSYVYPHVFPLLRGDKHTLIPLLELDTPSDSELLYNHYSLRLSTSTLFYSRRHWAIHCLGHRGARYVNSCLDLL